MPLTLVEAGRVPDREVLRLFEAIMARWETNSPLMAVGGFSYSHPSDEWRRAIEDGDTAVVTSATVSARDAAFSLHFRRFADPPRCELRLLWRDEPGASGPDGEEQALLALLRGLGTAMAPGRSGGLIDVTQRQD